MSEDLSYLIIVGSIAAISGLVNGVFTYMILSYISKRGIKVNYWMIRLYMFKYLQEYRKLTIEENGKPGNLYYAWIVTIILLTISAIIIIVNLVTGN
jgi:hypothetical protein